MANSATVNGGVIAVIPPNSNWLGSVLLSATLPVAIGGIAAAAVPTVTVSGSGGNMKDGDVLAAVALAVPAVNALALLGAQATDSVSSGSINVQSRANPLQLVLNLPAGVTAVAVAAGAVQ